MLSGESKSAVNVICGMFKAMTGQRMKILDNLYQKFIKERPENQHMVDKSSKIIQFSA